MSKKLIGACEYHKDTGKGESLEETEKQVGLDSV